MLQLYEHIRLNNPYALSYRMLNDVVQSYEHGGIPVPELTLVFNNRPDLDHRRYGDPSHYRTGEIAIILEGPLSIEQRRRAISVCRTDRVDCGDSWVYLKVTSPEADSLTYPVLFPLGIEGWAEKDPAWHPSVERFYPPARVRRPRGRSSTNRNLSFIDDEAIDDDAPPPPDDQDEHMSPEAPAAPHTRRRINLPTYTLLNYYQWNIHYRPTTEHMFSSQHYGGRLFQQYCVDAFSKVEEDRLNDYRSPKMQNQLRAASYLSLKKHLEYRARAAGANVLPGKPIVLPSSFTGGPRYMTQKYQDSMTMSRETDSLDLFITMPANAQWKEILDALEPGQKAEDRPDLTCRVFKMKLDELLLDLIQRKIFGSVAGYAWTIEYQKRGLPHVHILLVLKDKRIRLAYLPT